MKTEASREEQMIVLRRDSNGKPTVWCDPEIADLVDALNNGSLATVASCSGHGHRPGRIALADGRELLILPDFETGRALDRLFPDINGNLPHAVAEALDEARDARGADQVFYRAGKLVGLSQVFAPRDIPHED